MPKYRRIEVSASRRRVTIVSGEWTRGISEELSEQTDYGAAASDLDACECVSADSAEGQVILAEAMRSLQQRLSPDVRMALAQGPLVQNKASRNYFYLTLHSLYQLIRPATLRLRKEK